MSNPKMSAKVLSKKIESVAKNYFESKKNLNSSGVYLMPNLIDENDPSYKYVKRVNDTYASLNEVERSIINNDFFFQGYPDWWRNFFKRSSYYRYKKIAMVRFLEIFENE